MTTEQLLPGSYIGAPMGHYQSAYIVELAQQLGWPDEYPDETAALRAKYPDLDPETSELEIWQETVDDAEQWINDNLVPEGYWFGHHPDLGDVGVWHLEDHCLDCHHHAGNHDLENDGPCEIEGCSCIVLHLDTGDCTEECYT